ITLSSFRVKRLFSLFVWLTSRFVSRCAVSVEAQYRDFLEADKCLLQIDYQASFFSPKALQNSSNTGYLLF
ncbi:hypothetical protein, partial [Buttiauxella gaviniae]